MTTAGKINRDWWDNCLSNTSGDREEIERWFIRATNFADLEITEDLCVWTGQGWLTQEEIDEKCAHIDSGV